GRQDLGDVAHAGEDNRPEGGGQERTSDDRVCALRSSLHARKPKCPARSGPTHRLQRLPQALSRPDQAKYCYILLLSERMTPRPVNAYLGSHTSRRKAPADGPDP